MPLVGVFWLPALAFSECQQDTFFPCLLTHPGWGWPREAFIGQQALWGWSLTLGDAPRVSRRCREVGAGKFPLWFRFQGPVSPLHLC